MNTKYTVLLFIVGVLVIYLNKCQKSVEFLAPSGDEEMINQIRIENNMNNYLKFKKVQENIKKDLDFQIGYKELEDTDKKTIGFCPLGTFLNGDIPEELSGKDLEKCIPCLQCNQGYYLKEGCLGNSNSICEQGKVPFEVFLKAHEYPYKIHNLINPHQHKYNQYKEDDGTVKYSLSPINHVHV
tara:strand:+ start:194 stop:745 length:552 start_codon:yes stop_codon:yes gene_type:complete